MPIIIWLWACENFVSFISGVSQKMNVSSLIVFFQVAQPRNFQFFKYQDVSFLVSQIIWRDSNRKSLDGFVQNHRAAAFLI